MNKRITKTKYHFIIIGSGWRSMYYVRVAKALPDLFELDAMLCRTSSKAELISQEMNIHTTTSIEECENYQPDFVVVAVNKSSIGQVSKEWMQKGLTVLCETPPALNEQELLELWQLHQNGMKLCVAEQYFRYPTYQAVLNILDEDFIGDPYHVNISIAHEYHGASLMKKILQTENETFTITGKKYSVPVKETLSRYERFHDGRIAQKTRDVMTIEFEHGKTAFYDFCSEQYRSDIRNNYLKIQGVNGELQSMGSPMSTELCYMDRNHEPQKQYISYKARELLTDDNNPNLSQITEFLEMKLTSHPYVISSCNSDDPLACEYNKFKTSMYEDDPGRIMYIPQTELGVCALAEDETAIASLMLGAAKYKESGIELYPLKDALTDAYMAILMQKALLEPETLIQSVKQPWQEL